MEQTSSLIEFLTRVSSTLGDASLRLPEPERATLAAFIDNGLISRLKAPGAPLKVVFAGPTGSGKSTLINSVAGRSVTSPGVLRPTTTRSLVYSHVDSDATFSSDIPYDSVQGKAPILESFTLVDTPDIDSTNHENRNRAMDALSRADVVVFVTSALRYSDLVPWEVFRDISSRGTPIIFVLNRVSSSSSGVVTDFRRRARHEGMSMRVVRVEEHHLEAGAMLPAASIRDLRRALLASVPEGGEMTRRIDRGVAYAMAGIESLRRRVEVDQEVVLRLRDELRASLSFPGSFDIKSQVSAWRHDLKNVSRWTNRRGWLSKLESLADDIVRFLAISIERDLQLIAREGSKLLVDLTTGERLSSTQPTEELFRTWLAGVGPPGAFADLDRRHASAKIADAISSIEDLSDDPGQEGRSPDSSRGLRDTIETIYLDAVEDLESLSFQSEIEALDALIDSLVPTELIVANA